MLFKAFLVIAFLLATKMANAADAGKIIYVSGAVQMQNRPAILGAFVPEGAMLATGIDGYLYVKTIDNGLFILRPNSKARIVTYHVDTQNPSNTQVKLELIAGVARSRSGDAVKLARQNFRFNTPVAAIGVRGTDFTVFTDQDISRVAVMSGAITLSAFGDTCRREGGGPCEGGGSRDLSALQMGQLLQIQRGQAVPQLIQSRVFSPDAVAPPRGNEPMSKSGGSSNSSNSSNSDNQLAGEPNLDAQKAASLTALIDSDATSVAASSVPVMAPTPVVATVPTVVTPASAGVVDSQIVWGRWQPIVDQVAQIDFVTQATKNSLVALDGYYAIFLTQGQGFVSPVQGNAGFSLQGGEAYVINDNSAVAPTSASLQNGQLNVNFTNRTFSTSLDMLVGTQMYALQAQGSVGANGYLSGNLASSRFGYINVAGTLSAQNGGAAAYVFDGRITSTQTVNGISYWGH